MPIVVGNGIEIGNGITITSGPGGGGSVVTDNLIVELRPNSYPGSGTLWDNTVLAYPGLQGTLNNNPTYNPTTGFTFTQVSAPYQSVTIPHDAALNFNSSTNYTIEMWFNGTTQQAGDGRLAQKDNFDGTGQTYKCPFELTYKEATGVSYVAFLTKTVDFIFVEADVDVPKDTWCQVVGVYNWTSGDLLTYSNGVQNGQIGDLGAYAGANITSTAPVTLALSPNTIPIDFEFFRGQIGIFRIYSKALTSSEILQNFNADKNIFGI